MTAREQWFRRLWSFDLLRKPHPDAFWSDKYGWLEEATVDDLLAAIPKCKHGKIDGHEFWEKGDDGEWETWCEGALRAALGGNGGD